MSNKIIRKYETEERFSDHLDAIKEVIQVHTRKKGQSLNPNFLFADFKNEKERYNKFIISEMISANMIRQYIKDPNTAEELAQLIEKESDSYAILNRNNKGNPIVQGIIDREKEREEEAEEEKTSAIGGIMKRIRGSIKPKDEKEPEK